MSVCVLLLGGPDAAGRLSAPLAARTGMQVLATTAADHLDVAASVADDHALLIGCSVRPWPAHAELHAATSGAVPRYAGVVSWHGLPALHERLAAVVAPGARAGAHVLLTAPDPGADAAPADVAFLREVAEGVAAHADLRSRSIAWRGTTRTPTALDAIRSLVEAHGKRDIIECPVAPGSGSDPAIVEASAALGARVVCTDLGRETLLDLLAEVVATVVANELPERAGSA